MSTRTTPSSMPRQERRYAQPRLVELDQVRVGDLIAACHDKSGDTMPKLDDYVQVRVKEWHTHGTELHVNGNACYTCPVWRK